MASSEEELLDLITRPLSDEEMAAYQEVLDSGAFQAMMKQYHFQAGLDSARNIALKLGQTEGLKLEELLIGFAGFWLSLVNESVPAFDEQAIEAWLTMPLILADVLTTYSAQALQSYREHLLERYPEEWRELYTQFTRELPEVAPDFDYDVAAFDRAMQVTDYLKGFHEKLLQAGLQLNDSDYFDIWTHIFLQVYLFAYVNNPEFYYLLANNWPKVSPHLRMLLDLMCVLKGSEHLFLPENRQTLVKMLSDPYMQSKLAKRWDSFSDILESLANPLPNIQSGTFDLREP